MIVLLSTSDTDLLSARASAAGYRLGNPARLAAADSGAARIYTRLGFREIGTAMIAESPDA